MQYSVLPQIYDELMVNVDYPAWAKYLQQLLLEQGTNPTHILELGCGSGNVTLELLKLGYEVVGLDYSEEMLEIAEEKTEEFGNKIIYTQQDLREIDFEVYEIDAVVSANDTFNYLVEIKDVKHVLEYLYPRLKKGGQLIFDISSPYKLENTLGNNTYGESFENMVYLWENFYDKKERILNMDINFFEKENGAYKRYKESHIQRAHSIEEITNILEEIGYENIKVYGDFTKDSPKDKAERIFFSCKK